jgi:glycosyltransferase 2 family protein
VLVESQLPFGPERHDRATLEPWFEAGSQRQALGMTKSQRRWVGLGVVGAGLVLLFWHISRSPDWNQFTWQSVWDLFVHANPVWLLAALAGTYTSYVVRAYRWKFFLDPVKPASLKVLFSAQILGFSAVYLIGRPGELVRPAYIARWEGVPFVSQLAILVLERVYDSVAMALLFALALYLQPIPAGSPHAALTLHRMHEAAVLVLAATAALIVVLVLFRFRAEQLIGWLQSRAGFLSVKFRSGVASVAGSFAEGLDVIENWRDLGYSVACTAVLWAGNVTVFWSVYKSLGGRLAELSWWATTVTVFSAGVGLVAQLPGVGGGFQFAVLFALRQILHIPPAEATGAALLLWLIILVPCVLLGVALLIYGGLSFKHLHAMVQAEQAASSGHPNRETA